MPTGLSRNGHITPAGPIESFLEILKIRAKRRPYLSVAELENGESQTDIFSSALEEKPTILKEVEIIGSDPLRASEFLTSVISGLICSHLQPGVQ